MRNDLGEYEFILELRQVKCPTTGKLVRFGCTISDGNRHHDEITVAMPGKDSTHRFTVLGIRSINAAFLRGF